MRHIPRALYSTCVLVMCVMDPPTPAHRPRIPCHLPLPPPPNPRRTLPLCESSREDVVDAIRTFVQPPRYGQSPYHCLIISYETFRLHAASLAVPGACDLLICDEVRPSLAKGGFGCVALTMCDTIGR